MLDDSVVNSNQTPVLRLSSILSNSIEKTLRQIGVDPANIEATASALSRVKINLTANEIVDDTFRPRKEETTPYPIGRFSDGSFGVYYSALEESTCKKEIIFHTKDQLEQIPNRPRYFSLIECKYSGITSDLRGSEIDFPKLVSKTNSGYSFCQRLAKQAIKQGFDGLFTMSARHDGGTCVPVFTRTALREPIVKSKYTLQKIGGKATFRGL